MLYERSINIDLCRENNGTVIGTPVAPRSPLASARLAVFAISPGEAEFAARGFRPTDPDRRGRLETVGRCFVAGYNAAIASGQGQAAAAQLPQFPEGLRGFVVEGAAMGLALLDILTPWRGRRFAAFVEGPAQPYIYLAYVGAGWALARTSRRLAGRLGRLDPLLSWLTLDGYGFHEGYFRPGPSFEAHRRPRLPGYSANAYDQGLGRALWFAMGASGEAVREAVEGFAAERRADLWSGVGLAAAYAGGAGTEELAELARAAGGCRLDLGQGAAFAAAAHLRAGAMPDHTDAACRTLCGMDGAGAAAITDAARPQCEADPDGRHYEAWRRAIRAAIGDSAAGNEAEPVPETVG